MSAASGTAHAEAALRRARPRPARGATSQRRVAGGAVTIVVAAVLLAGVVALNVAVLRLNLRLDGLGRDRAKLQADNSILARELATAADSAKIQSLAASRLGFVPANPAQVEYISIAPGK